MQFNKKIRKILAESVIAFLITILVIVCVYTPAISGFADGVDYSVFNNNKTLPNDDIVIVAIDEATINNDNFKSYKDISRADYANAIRNILRAEPRAVAVDVLFFNPADGDEELAKIATENANVIFAEEYLPEEKRIIKPNFVIENEGQMGIVGMTTNSENKNNIINQAQFVSRTDGVSFEFVEPFAMRVWRAGNIGKQEGEYVDTESVYEIEGGRAKRTIPVVKDKNGAKAIDVNFFSSATHEGAKTYPRISFFDAYMNELNPADIKDKYVLIGDTASDAHDTFITPTSHGVEMPGVEIHANFLQTIMEDSFPRYQNNSQKVLLVIFLTLAIVIICESFGFLGSSVFVIFAGVLLYFSWIYIYSEKNFVISVFFPILSAISVWTAIYIYRFTREEKQSRVIRESFSKYVSEDIVNQIIEHPELVELGGQSLEVSVMFSDLEGFTSISENLTNKELLSLLNEYLDKMSEIILAYGGTIDKFMGDGIMSYLGAPLPKKDHAVLTCETALAQIKALKDINQSLENRSLPRVNMRIGVNTGIATAGNIGTRKKVEYTLIGDEVNLGSRLESVNKRYGTNIIISEKTKNKIGDKFFIRELDSIRVKGKNKPVCIYELIDYTGQETEIQAGVKYNYEKGLAHYRAQEWSISEEFFHKNKNDAPSQNMLERIEKLKKDHLDKNWDGVYTFNSK